MRISQPTYRSTLGHVPFALLATAVVLVFGIAPALADNDPAGGDPAADKTSQSDPSVEEFLQQLGVKWRTGKEAAPVGTNAEVQLQGRYRLLNQKDTNTVLEAMGNLVSPANKALLAPADHLDWFIVFQWEEIGYVKDDEKDDIDKAALLKHFRESSQQGNEMRAQMGLSPMNLKGWAVEPFYNEQAHSLEWGLRFESEGAEVVNYYTKRLGRRGVMECNLVVDPEDLEAVLPEFRQALDGFDYRSGEMYSEFRAGDKVAQYGLTALVAGGAMAVAAKSGLLGKLWKFLLIGVIAIGAVFRKAWQAITGGGREASI